MKLNLLPTYVSKEKAAKSAWVIAVILFLVCLGGSIYLVQKGNHDFASSVVGVDTAEGNAKEAKDTADAADNVIAQSTTLLRNTLLAKAMLAHNKDYPDLYDQVKKYIPSFYRVNSMSAEANGPDVSTITLVGELDTDQQYADLMLALLRWDKVRSLSRGGFTSTNMYVPNLTPDDQVGKPIHPGQSPIPDDPYKRLDYLLAQGKIDGYLGQGGFGAGQSGPYGPMPGASEVTVTIVVQSNLQTPDPRATLAVGGASAPAAGGGGPAATGGSLPATNASAPAPPSSGPSGSDSGTTRIGRGKKAPGSEDESD